MRESSGGTSEDGTVFHGGILRLDDESRRVRLAALLVALIVGTVYLPTVLSADFVDLDDGQYVVENPLVRQPSWASAWRFLREIRDPSTVAGYYQPLTMLSLMTDAWLSGDPPAAFPFHLTNIALHIVNCILLMAILRELFGGVALPALAALLFGLHPVQVEAVSWISQRKAVLAGALALSAVWCHLRWARTGRPAFVVAVSGFFLLAMLSKPTVMGLPLLLVLLDAWPLRRASRRTIFLEKGPLIVIAIVGMWIAYDSQSRTLGLGAPNFARLLDLVTLCAFNLVMYARNVIWPTALCLIYPLPTSLQWSTWSAGGCVALTLIGMIAWLTSWRWSRAVFVALGGAAAMLGVAIGPVRFMQSCVGDRFLYLPLAALLLIPVAVGAGIARGGEALQPIAHTGARRASVALLLCACCGLCVPLNWRRQAVWVDARALWMDVLHAAPDHSYGHAGIARWLYLEGRDLLDAGRLTDAMPVLTRALDHIDRALSANPDYAEFRMNRAEALIALGRGEDAIVSAQEALAAGLGAKESQGRVVLGRALLAANRFDEARAAFDAILQSTPSVSFSLRMSMGHSMLEHHRPDAAIPYFSAALADSPREPTALQLLASSFAALSRWSDAAPVYQLALSVLDGRGLQATEVELGLAKVLLELGQADEAERLLESTELRANYEAECRLASAGVAALRGQIDAAFRELAAAVRLDPRLSAVAVRKSYFSSLRGDPRWTQLIEHRLPTSAPLDIKGAASSPAGAVP